MSNLTKNINDMLDLMDSPQDKDDVIYLQEAPPLSRLQYLFLRRLSGHEIFLSLPPTKQLGMEELGVMDFDNVFDFDMTFMKFNGFLSEFDFTTDKGYTGVIRLDWLSRVLTIVVGDDVMNFTISRMFPFSIVKLSDKKLQFGLSIDTVEADDLESAKEKGMTGFDIDRVMVEMGVFAQMSGGGYIPTRQVTAKEVSDITDISTSTLSDIKTGKRTIDNLTFSTLSLLSTYGNIKQLDGLIYDAFVNDRPKCIISDEAYTIVIMLKNDERYEITPSNNAVGYYEEMIDDYYSDVGDTLMLENVHSCKGDEVFIKCVLLKSEISSISLKSSD